MSSVRQRLLLVLIALAVAGGVGTFLTFGVAQVQLGEERTIAAAAAAGMEGAAALAVSTGEQQAALDAYLMGHDPAAFARYLTASVKTDSLLADLQARAVGSPDATAAVERVMRSIEAWQASYARPVLQARDDGGAPQPVTPATVGKGLASFSAIMTDLASLHETLGRPAIDAQGRADLLGHARLAALVGTLIALAVMSGIVARLVARWITGPLRMLLTTAKQVAAGSEGYFDSSGDDEIGMLAIELAGMHESLLRQRIAADAGRFAVEDRAARDSVLSRFIELADFLATDQQVAGATLEALDSLAAPEAAVIHIYNASRDRAIPLAFRGEISAVLLSLHSFDACPGIRRASVFVNEDVALPLGIRCPIVAPEAGRLACIPLVALGENVGVIHAWWSDRGALPAEPWAAAQRLIQQAALSIANRRLVTQLQAMADTDPRTNLPNNRAFDRLLEQAFEQRSSNETFAVLLLDIDHFKLVNDRFGHPAGDEALKAFAGILRGSLRDDDVAARYGGEEFTVFLPRADDSTAALVSERIRARLEGSQIVLGPGVTTSITCSIGYAVVPIHATDRSEVMHAADRAVYVAKETGRNRVVGAGGDGVLQQAPGAGGTQSQGGTVAGPDGIGAPGHPDLAAA